MKAEIISFIIKKRMKSILKHTGNPVFFQENILKNIIKKGEHTIFGLENNFNQINDYTTFKHNVPIRTYEELFPYIKKAREGVENVLWPGRVKWFAKSSGTTNAKSKFIPITKDSLYDGYIKAGKDMLSIYENNFPKQCIYKGKGLMLGGSIEKEKYYYEGDVSAILLNEFPAWVNYHRIPKIETALMSKWETKIDKIIDESINENITNITGVPSWMLILLKKMLKKSGANYITDIWPNLELYIHGGINFSPYKELFNQIIGKEINYLEGYNASEGFFAIQDQNKLSELLLMCDYGVFYEFIPLNEYQKGSKNAIAINDVELNQDYVLVISTNAGLWRYIIGDVIKFTSLHPYRIQIIGRTKHYINVFGEELMIHNTDNAILKTCKTHNCKIKDYTVAPIFINKKSGGHEWLIEFEKKPENIILFSKELDQNLQKINSDYEAKRTGNLILKIPKITILNNNQFYNWLKKHNRLGGQYKIPRLSNNRKIIDEIINL